MSSWKVYLSKARDFVRSSRFFVIVLAVFIFSAAWIALSGRFSMAYDENTHLGLIQLYSERWLPFWSEAPEGSEIFGAVERDPSYLYHYVLSFPFRILDNFVQSQFWQVLALRFINIGLFVAGIIAYRRLMLRTGAGPGLAHAVLAVFVLLPATPFLAAQINYDNALFLASGVVLLMATNLSSELKRTGRFNVAALGILLGTVMLASLIKYAFLPILAALILWLGYAAWKYAKPRNFWPRMWEDFGRMRLFKRAGLVILVIVGAVLFFERYGLNAIRYQTPTPECNQVIGVEPCRSYGPWNRNYELRQQKLNGSLADAGPNDPISFTVIHWLKSMAHQLVFTLNGRSDYFKVGEPLPVSKLLVLVVGGAGVVLAVFLYGRLRRIYNLDILATVTFIYLILLWTQNYTDYLHLGQAVALQGRYLMPVLPLLMLIMALAYAKALRRFAGFKLGLATICVVGLLLQGGGATTFIVRSDERWYWQNQTIIQANQSAQKLLKRFVIGS